MSSLLHRAFTPDAPGPPMPPGPRANDWRRAGAIPTSEPSDEATLLDELWCARGFHRDATGQRTSVPRRMVPSAGGTYAVQWHVLVPPGTGSALPPGRWTREESGTLLRRPGPPPAGACVSLVLTVQPGRSFGRYRHRAWPLWVADSAYALEGVRALVPAARLPPSWSLMVDVREVLAVPPAAEAHWWLDRGLVPELCLARIELPDRWRVDDPTVRALRTRRSPSLEAFARAAARRPAHQPPPAATRDVAEQSGQAWVLGATGVESWPRPRVPTGAAAYDESWRAHRRAAELSYQLAATGVPSRPVSGFTRPPGPRGRPLLHGLALLDPKDVP
ncbi:hypothetical protein GCM10009821_23310 [Aeromicrobium halocynthiae]|uniref:Uncharacterized protein n=1 Tax=Aeromicrobium halocynthiae TaxID=560557 RepID=A0ABN2W4R2_9ACTN